MKRNIAIFAASLTIAALLLAGCAAADVVLKYSPGSLDTIVKDFPKLITDNTTVDHYYYLMIDGAVALRISHDYDLTGGEDIVMETALKPFADAGLDTAKLGEGYRVDGDKLLLTTDYGKGTGMKNNVRDSLFEAVKADRSKLSYHQLLDHYGVKLAHGKFEWAKDYKTNDKDIVFVIAAKPLADIGVDVQNIEGWVFKTMDEPDGSKVDVLLKPYDLK